MLCVLYSVSTDLKLFKVMHTILLNTLNSIYLTFKVPWYAKFTFLLLPHTDTCLQPVCELLRNEARRLLASLACSPLDFSSVFPLFMPRQVLTPFSLCCLLRGGGRRGETAGVASPRKQALRDTRHCLPLPKCPAVSVSLLPSNLLRLKLLILCSYVLFALPSFFFLTNLIFKITRRSCISTLF